MRTYEERTDELHRRMKNRRQTRQRRRFIGTCAASGSVCLVAVIFIALGISHISGKVPNMVPGGAAASILANNSLQGYVIVALLSLCLGILLTVFCIRLKQHMDEEKDDV